MEAAMTVTPEDGLRLVDSIEPDEDREAPPRLERGSDELEALRDEFVDAFNARDLEAVLALASADIECPDIHGDGAASLAEELDAIWRRSPGAILTRAFLDGSPCGMAWLPDEDGCWARAALVCFDCADGLLSLVEIPDDVDALERAEADDPVGEELEEGTDWAEWDSGEATVARPRDRDRP
jgi:hypothetical protein